MLVLKKEKLEDLVKEGNHLVDFSATWCGPCKMMESVFAKIDKKIDIIKVDVDKFSDLTKEYRIMSVPTMIFFKDGEVIGEEIGFHDESEMLDILDKYFK